MTGIVRESNKPWINITRMLRHVPSSHASISRGRLESSLSSTLSTNLSSPPSRNFTQHVWGINYSWLLKNGTSHLQRLVGGRSTDPTGVCMSYIAHLGDVDQYANYRIMTSSTPYLRYRLAFFYRVSACFTPLWLCILWSEYPDQYVYSTQ